MATPAESFRRFTPFTVTLTALTFVLIVVGATTRAVGAGLSCPDWPLCNGKLIPTFEGGVFFEWFHRLIAGSVSMLFMGLVVWALVDRNLRARLWGVMTFAVGMLIVPIVITPDSFHRAPQNSTVATAAYCTKFIELKNSPAPI